METTSPKITNISWGEIEIDGERTLKDAKLFPGGARKWNWKKTGTHHSPGIQPADVEELLEHGAKAIVLSRGVLGRLEVCPETLALLEEKGVEIHVLKTDDAAKLYNELRETLPTGGLFHSTC